MFSSAEAAARPARTALSLPVNQAASSLAAEAESQMVQRAEAQSVFDTLVFAKLVAAVVSRPVDRALREIYEFVLRPIQPAHPARSAPDWHSEPDRQLAEEMSI